MEKDLDEVEDGKRKWVSVVDQFYKPFAKELSKAEIEMEKKFKSKMNLLDLIVTFAVTQWLLN